MGDLRGRREDDHLVDCDFDLDIRHIMQLQDGEVSMYTLPIEQNPSAFGTIYES